MAVLLPPFFLMCVPKKGIFRSRPFPGSLMPYLAEKGKVVTSRIVNVDGYFFLWLIMDYSTGSLKFPHLQGLPDLPFSIWVSNCSSKFDGDLWNRPFEDNAFEDIWRTFKWLKLSLFQWAFQWARWVLLVYPVGLYLHRDLLTWSLQKHACIVQNILLPFILKIY